MNGRLSMACLTALGLAGCATTEQGSPLIFGRTQTIGIGVQGTAADQGASLTLGFNDRNLAIVPTTQIKGDAIRSTAHDERAQQFTDALSVLGQFEANAEGVDVRAGLGTFFATGMAARSLSQGFEKKLGSETPKK